MTGSTGRPDEAEQGATQVVIIADDLSGAADSGIVCASAGLDTLVVFGDAAWRPSRTSVLAIDADTRARSRADAVQITSGLVALHAGRGRTLFRKVDSTLRGHVAAEIAATLRARRQQGDPIVVLAPAFPAAGRTTRNGHQHVHGVPLEQTEIWSRELMTGPAHMPSMLAPAGLSAAVIGLDAVRGAGLAQRVAAAANGHDVLVFDAERDEDLGHVAAAVRAALDGREVVWAGSAGLARHLPHASGTRPAATSLPAAGGPILFVVGSASEVSRRQAERLLSGDPPTDVAVPVSVLRAGASAWAAARAAAASALGQGHDTLVRMVADGPVALAEGPALCRALAALVAPVGGEIGALVSTGGETARAVLDVLGATGLRLRGEIEPGVPVSIADGGRPIPVVTKAGAFGHDDTLHNCRRALRRGLSRSKEILP